MGALFLPRSIIYKKLLPRASGPKTPQTSDKHPRHRQCPPYYSDELETIPRTRFFALPLHLVHGAHDRHPGALVQVLLRNLGVTQVAAKSQDAVLSA